MPETTKTKQVIVRQYGLLNPLNWDQDCADHLYLQNKFWNRLVEIEREHRTAYRAIVNADEAVSVTNQRIADIKQEIADQDELRKAARKEHQAKKGKHTKPFDDRIAELKKQIRELSPEAKELRTKAREQAKEALAELEPIRKEAVKKARFSRTVAAVSVLREWIVKQAAKTGSQISSLAVASSATCHKCGEKVKPGSSGPVRTCHGCGASWDEDDNAAINLYRALEE